MSDHPTYTAAALLVVLLLFGAIVGFGQGIVTGSITGWVMDNTGAVVVGAKITVRHIETNQLLTTASNESGIFLFPKLSPGKYALTIEAVGFAKREFVNTQVEVAKQTSLGEVRLLVGPGKEMVEVTAATPLVESTTAQISTTISSQKVSELPIGRGMDQLALYLPGVATAGSAGRGNNNGSLFSANGQRPRSNNFQIDGQGMNDPSVTGPAIFLANNDLIAEYQVITHYDAAYGRNTGSQVNLITKSGSNTFHGTAFEIWRGSIFDSLTNREKSPLLGYCDPNNPAPRCTDPKVSRYVRNMFGGTVGGPILKDKLWFFASAYWDRERLAGAPITSGSLLVPTLNGTNQLRAAFPNSAGVGYLAKFGPAVTAGNPVFAGLTTRNVSDGTTTVPVEFGTVSRNISGVTNDRQFSGRIDWQVTSKDRFFGRYLIDDNISTNLDYGDGAGGFVVDVPNRGQQIGLDWTHQFSNTMFNQARLNYTRLWVLFGRGTTGCDGSDPAACPTYVAFRDATLLNYGLANTFPQGRLNNTWQVQDNASKVIGRHQIKFGGEFGKLRSPSDFLPNYNGVYTFTTFNDLIQNRPYRLSMADGQFRINYKEKDLSFYFQDDWRVTSKLTLQLGLRWEWFEQALNELHRLTVAQQTGPNPFWLTSLPLDRTTIPKFPEDLNNFGPVVGFAWTPFDGTVIRGGFRVAYDPSFYNINLNVASNAPVLNSGTLTQGLNPVVPGLPASGFTGADARSVGLSYIPVGVDPGTRTQSLVVKDFHNPYSEQWNVGIQREISPRMAAEIRYLGNHSVGLFQQVNSNPALNTLITAGFGNLIPAGLTPCVDPTQPGYGTVENPVGYANCARRNVLTRTNTGYSHYHGLQSRFDMRDFHGLLGSVSYTWSHLIDNASDIYSTVGAGMLAISQNPFDVSVAERGNSNFDYRHTLGLQLIYAVPSFRGQQGFLGRLLSGWQPNVTYRYATGQPYTPIQQKASTLCDPTGTFSTTTDACRPILGNEMAPFNAVGQITSITGGVPRVVNIATGQTTTLDAVHWIINDNVAAQYYGTPFAGVRRNQWTGQPTHAMNFALQKNTKLNERFTFQLRVTAFNVLNHQFLGVPGNTINLASTSFGNWRYNAAGGANPSTLENGLNRRRLEFSGKIVF